MAWRRRSATLTATCAAFTFALAGCSGGATSENPTTAPATAAASLKPRVIVEPNDGQTPLLDLIASARKTVDVVIYQFSDDQIAQALIDAHDAGRAVRVLFSWQLFPGFDVTNPDGRLYSSNTPTFNRLRAAGVQVAWTRHQFPYTHQKSIVVDAGTADSRSLIADFNFDPHYFSNENSYDPRQAGTRGFALLTSQRSVADQMTRVFNADWPPYQVGQPYTQPQLVWSPTTAQFPGEPNGNSGIVLPGIITGARRTLDIYLLMADKNDPQISQVAAAAKRGVAVRVVTNCGTVPASAINTMHDAGVKIGYRPTSLGDSSKYLFIHAKSLVADFGDARQLGFVGSQNTFLEQSLAALREAGMKARDTATLTVLHDTFTRDFTTSQASCSTSPVPSKATANPEG